MQNLQLNELLRLDHRKSYKKTTVLEDLSLSIKDGRNLFTLLRPHQTWQNHIITHPYHCRV